MCIGFSIRCYHVLDFGLITDNYFTSLVSIPFLWYQDSVFYWKIILFGLDGDE